MYIALGIGLDSSVAVVIDQMRVPFAVILGYFIFGENINKLSAFGIILAILGTVIITGTPNVTNNYLPMWIMLSSSAAWAFYNIQVKNLRDVQMLSFIGWISLFGAPQLFIISAIFEHGQAASLLVFPVASAISLLYMAIFVTIIGHGCWYYLLQKHPISHVVPYSLLTPVFGMAASIIFLKEQLSWHVPLGAILTLVGVATIVVTKKPASLKKLESF
jgi:O-acetylserine/cysteine efflux transporter